jgi:hypothetical protein
MFARPFLLVLLAALPVWWWLRSRRRQPSVPYSDVTQVTQIGSRRRWLAELPVGLRSLALVGAPFARPRGVDHRGRRSASR